MEAKVQETLASVLQHVREVKAQRVADLRPYIAYAAGVVAGLEDAGNLTGREAGEWKKKLDEISAEPTKRMSGRPKPSPVPLQPNLGFIKLVPGPRDPEPFLDGFMRIVALELFTGSGSGSLESLPAAKPLGLVRRRSQETRSRH
jgi:hypothetical protein